MEILINSKRITDEFMELVSIDSVSFRERKMADCLVRKLKEMGFEVYEDSAGRAFGSDTGNIYGFLKGTIPGQPLLFSAHMDTVEPGIEKKPVLHGDGTIESSGDTVLGADDVAGIVEILEGIRSVKEAGVQYGDIEVLFPIAEEVYIKGTGNFDFSTIKSKEAYVFDLSGSVGTAAISAPSLVSFKISVRGRAAHAGFDPEHGINAVAAACLAVSQIDQGRLDDETTCNIGLISGGAGINIVPDTCVCIGEVRSFNHKKAVLQVEKIKSVFEKTAAGFNAEIHAEISVNMEAYKIDRSSHIVERFLKACGALELEGQLVSTFGGSDNNNLVKNGIEGIVLSCGMFNVHSRKEYTLVRELEKGTRLVAELITSQV